MTEYVFCGDFDRLTSSATFLMFFILFFVNEYFLILIILNHRLYGRFKYIYVKFQKKNMLRKKILDYFVSQSHHF